jgi:uncharacterized protein DUF2786/SprT-like family protein
VLSTQLEAALLRALRVHYDYENDARFGRRLVPAVLVLSDTTTRLGVWNSATRTIEISRALVFARPWLAVASVLEHEMAHQYVHEVLRAHGEPPHGETFQRVCAERGIDARAFGEPVPAAASPAEDKVLERIRKLLALAGSANQHEAELAMRKAHELMLRHNVESASARGAYEVRHLGDPTKRRTRVEGDVAGLLGEFFFVKVIRVPVFVVALGKTGWVFELAGARANLDMAAHVWEFLLATAARLWEQNRSDARVRSGRDRLSYQAGVIRGFSEKLGAERRELRGTGLVWVRDADLERFYRARHPRITTRRTTTRLDGAHAAGREAGRTVVLHRPVTQGPSGGTRLLRG